MSVDGVTVGSPVWVVERGRPGERDRYRPARVVTLLSRERVRVRLSDGGLLVETSSRVVPRAA